ncbi:FxSxx-COOH system tetratricopeptide repeat protein [Jidongwangia harbinensis]|uniref:FxSxx-COOH system tetratricopeptide repeat protein n=1 Tax=Jidongwangia harbinensis TaxID=2878561 RepID=UPI001CD91B5A|nr:FxSxx-COOH system tetratricopeptide repeat protein [Jidongwangia harbinensis]MCA2215739.1 tetratricopeptide repeat protein [Jidongwangia harbinensis]
MAEQRHGKVVTFYSYRGGTGRTMALANVAWILAANGKRVLIADWDLEAPGLHRFFEPFLKAETVETSSGVIDLIREYEWQATRNVDRGPDWHKDFARVQRHAFSVNWDHFPEGGQLDYLSAGRHNQNYAAAVTGMNWDDFYGRLGGGAFLDALRADMHANYDYTLIASRTGLSDVADICTIHLPDVLVDCFTFSERCIAGGARVAAAVMQRHAKRDIRILPVAMRVDPAEKDKADAGRVVAMQRFPGLPADMTPAERARYWNAVEVPYRPFYAYEETLATFGDRPGQTTSLLAAYENLADYISDGEVTAMPPMDEALRARTASRFVRRLGYAEEEVTLQYAPEDQLWAEWISGLLGAVGVTVHDPDTPASAAAAGSGRRLTVVSHANASSHAGLVPRDRTDPRPPLAVYVEDVAPVPGFPVGSSAFIGGKSGEVAAERVLRLVGRPDIADADLSAIGVRFPGDQVLVFNPPVRNARFTGRERDLLDLRTRLRGGGPVVRSGPMPVALQGLGGIGKTQVALEYAHRFRNAYDIVWWIDAEQVAFIDIALSDLGHRLGLALPQSSVLDAARAVLNSLERGTPYARWLLIFDNAEDVERVLPFIPRGPGHVLITSRNSQWGDHAQPVHIDVFPRTESIAHLRHRVPTIERDQADRIADVLGDLPVAVAAAGAWLADTGERVGDYLGRVERSGPGHHVDQVWELSLELLRRRSGAAYRLLQLCSVLAPEISLDLVYSDELAAALSVFDPLVSERAYRGSLVQHLNRLALLKLDVGRSQIQVHRLLQHVVRSRMTEAELAEARHQMHLVLSGLRPRHEIDDPRSWPRFRTLWPHLELSHAAACNDESVRQLMIDRVRYIWFTGGLAEGRRFGEDIDRRWSEMLSAEQDPRAAVTLQRQLLHLRFNVANIVRQTGQFEEARALDETVLAEQTELLGPHHPHALMTAGGLGGDLRALGRYADARSRDEETYAAWVEYFGEDHPRTLSAKANLAVSLGSAGRPDLAVPLLEDARERLNEVVGPDHPYTLAAEVNLAILHAETDAVPAALQIMDVAVERHRDVLGPDHPDTLRCTANRALMRIAVGESPGEDATAGDRLAAVLGDDHPAVSALRAGRYLHRY